MRIFLQVSEDITKQPKKTDGLTGRTQKLKIESGTEGGRKELFSLLWDLGIPAHIFQCFKINKKLLKLPNVMLGNR